MRRGRKSRRGKQSRFLRSGTGLHDIRPNQRRVWRILPKLRIRPVVVNASIPPSCSYTAFHQAEQGIDLHTCLVPMLLFMISFEMFDKSVQAAADIAQLFDDDVRVFHVFLPKISYGFDNTTVVPHYPGSGARSVANDFEPSGFYVFPVPSTQSLGLLNRMSERF